MHAQPPYAVAAELPLMNFLTRYTKLTFHFAALAGLVGFLQVDDRALV